MPTINAPTTCSVMPKTTFGVRLKGPIANYVAAAHRLVQQRIPKNPGDPAGQLTDTKLMLGMVTHGPSPEVLINLMYPPTIGPAEHPMEIEDSVERLPEIAVPKSFRDYFGKKALVCLALTSLLTALTLAATCIQDGTLIADLKASNQVFSIRSETLEKNNKLLRMDAEKLTTENQSLTKRLDEWKAAAPVLKAYNESQSTKIASLEDENAKLKNALNQRHTNPGL